MATVNYVITNKFYGRDFINFRLQLEGFKEIPKMFKPDGQGFSNGKPILEILRLQFRNFKLTISAKKPSVIIRKGRGTSVNLSHKDLQEIGRAFYTNRKPFNHKIVLASFNRIFPKYFQGGVSLVTYQKGILTSILKNANPSQISGEDRQALIDFLPKISSKGLSYKSLLKQKADYQLLYLEKTVNDLSELVRKTSNEAYWQNYVRSNILYLHESYIKRIEHLNVSLDVRLPDFCLLDYDNYLDILEIKTPQTTLLNEDKSHKNYYWSVEICKAISQAENYLNAVAKFSDAICNRLRDQDIDVRVIKPRAIILAGNDDQLGPKLKRDNFRLLNEALKDTQIITYDDLVTSSTVS
jgi:hypothetical protein